MKKLSDKLLYKEDKRLSLLLVDRKPEYGLVLMKISEVIRDSISDDCRELLNTVIYILIMSSGQWIDQTKLLNGLTEWENMFFMCLCIHQYTDIFFFSCIIQYIQNGDTSSSDHRTPSVVLDIESLAQSSDFCSGSPKMTVSSFLFIVNLGSSSHKDVY